MLLGPHRQPFLPFSLGILPSRLSQYSSTGSSLTCSHGFLPPGTLATLRGGSTAAEDDDGGARGTIFPERVAACEVDAAAATTTSGVAAPESGRDERADGAWRGWYATKRRSPWLIPRDSRLPSMDATRFSPPLGWFESVSVSGSIESDVSRIYNPRGKQAMTTLERCGERGRGGLTLATRADMSSEGSSWKRKLPSLLRMRTS